MIDRTLTAAPPVAWAAQLMMTRPRPSTTVEAVTAAAPARGAWRQDGGPQGIITPLPDPDRPKGPPPSFDANVLEGERERLRRPAMLRPDMHVAEWEGTDGKNPTTTSSARQSTNLVTYDRPSPSQPHVDLAV